MENASKALIMAGAILIAIILISVGISVMNSTSGVVDEVNSQTSSVAAQMFNSKITPYFGNNVEGAKVKALLSYIITVNSSASQPILVNTYSIFASNKSHQSSAAQIQKIYEEISTLSNYKVVLTTGCGTYKNGGYKTDGTIGCISITKLP